VNPLAQVAPNRAQRQTAESDRFVHHEYQFSEARRERRKARKNRYQAALRRGFNQLRLEWLFPSPPEQP
jgi:hypothetical protein